MHSNTSKYLKKKKIILFASDPGGANSVVSIFKRLDRKKYNLFLYGKDGALKIYRKMGARFTELSSKIPDFTQKSIFNFVKNHKPDLIITGTSANDFTERYFWAVSEKNNIISYAVLDHWVNYGVRFSNYCLKNISDFNKEKTIIYTPTRILLTDKFAEKIALEDGLNADKLFVVGNPYFEYLEYKKINLKKKINKKHFNEKIGIKDNGPVFLFVSEPISTEYEWEKYLGYNEMTILDKIISIISLINKKYKEKIIIIIKPHPKEEIRKFYSYLKEKKVNVVIIPEDIDVHELILFSDIVIGMYSMLLIESVILGSPVASVQIGLKRQNPFILNNIGVVKTILTEDELYHFVESFIKEGQLAPVSFNYIVNPVYKISKMLEEDLCIN